MFTIYINAKYTYENIFQLLTHKFLTETNEYTQ